MKISRTILLCTIVFCAVVTACHSKKTDQVTPSGPNEPTSFTFSPVDVSKISFLLSLGWLQPIGHTIPTDHVYFWYTKDSNNTPLPVYAPGGGRIDKILNVPVLGINEVKVWITMNDKFGYYLDHVVLNSSVKEGDILKAGQAFATTGLGNSIDLGAIDYTINVPFANPMRYGLQTIHCGKPFQYFTEPLKTQLYSLVDREGTEKDGWVNVDVSGHLSGNWFLDGSTFYTDGPDGWDKELSFAFDIQHPSTVMVSIGGQIGLVGKWSLQQGAIAPADVSPANGKMAYQLWAVDPNPPHSADQRGLMLVQMTDNTHIKVEVFPGLKAADGAFDANARMYAR